MGAFIITNALQFVQSLWGKVFKVDNCIICFRHIFEIRSFLLCNRLVIVCFLLNIFCVCVIFHFLWYGPDYLSKLLNTYQLCSASGARFFTIPPHPPPQLLGINIVKLRDIQPMDFLV